MFVFFLLYLNPIHLLLLKCLSFLPSILLLNILLLFLAYLSLAFLCFFPFFPTFSPSIFFTSNSDNLKCISSDLRIVTHTHTYTNTETATSCHSLPSLYRTTELVIPFIVLLFGSPMHRYLHCIYHLSCKNTEAFTCPSTIACCKRIYYTNKCEFAAVCVWV